MEEFKYEEYYEKIICELEDKAQTYEKQLFEFEQLIESLAKDIERQEEIIEMICEEFGLSTDMVTQHFACIYLKEDLGELLPAGWYLNTLAEDYKLGFPDKSIYIPEEDVQAVMEGVVDYLENDDYILCKGNVMLEENVIIPNFEREDIHEIEFTIPREDV
jgi:hypothetical protein